MVENVESVEKDCKKSRSGFGFGINDCPLWLFKEFSTEAKSKYNDQYWVLLLDWYRKARAFELLSQGKEGVVESVKEESCQEVKLMGRG